MGKRVGQSSGVSSPCTPTMATNTHQPPWGVLGYTGEHVTVAVFWNPQGLPYATFLRPLQHPCLHLPPWAQPIAAKLLSFRDPPLFFLSLESPEPEVDRTRMGHALKQRKGSGQEDEAGMPTRPPHMGALHNTPLYISGNCYFAAFCLG